MKRARALEEEKRGGGQPSQASARTKTNGAAPRGRVVISGPPEGAPLFDRARFAARARALLAAAREACASELAGAARGGIELSVALVDDSAMAKLNAAHRGRSGATDVLSFSLLEGEHREFHGGLLGDVVIAPAVAARAAHEQGAALDDELLRLLIHGVLHLLGHDHEREDEARIMRARESELWKRVAAAPAAPKQQQPTLQ